MGTAESGNLLDHVGLELLGKTAGVLGNARVENFNALTDLILASPRIFLTGAGRSGLVCRFFAMRLMHLGGIVYIVGETTTPAARSGDLLITISGSGKTQTVLDIARMAKQTGARIATIGLDIGSKSPMDELADLSVKLNRRLNPHLRQVYAATKQIPREERQTLTPMGTVFEIATLIYLEAIIAEVINRQNVPESEMRERHANLE
jgi:6-phospho 3-hexuloisomerase